MLRLIHNVVILYIIVPAIFALETHPFIPPSYHGSPFDILKRASKCGKSCSSMGENVCCGKKTVCALDQVGNVACCPFDAVCTGTIVTGATPTPKPPVAAAANTFSGAISHAISATETIQNQYYPYPVLPTTFVDEKECSSSISSCQAESAKCTGYIEGGGYGVTVNGQGGEITNQAAIPASSVESICSSLSEAACHGIQLSACPNVAGATASASNGGFIEGASSNDGQNLAVRWRGIGIGVGLVGCLFHLV